MTGRPGRAGGEDGSAGGDATKWPVDSGDHDRPRTPASESRAVIVCDDEGDRLTDATIRLDGGLRLIVLADVAEAQALMDYYFGRGGNRVFVVCDGSSTEGRLETRWHGIGRTWMVRMLTPLAKPIPSAAPQVRETPAETVVVGTARSG